MASKKKFPTLEEKNAAEAKAQAEEKPLDSGNAVSPESGIARFDKDQTISMIELFKAWLVAKGAGLISIFDWGKSANPPVREEAYDDGETRLRRLVDPPKLGFEEALNEKRFYQGFFSLILLAFPDVWSRYVRLLNQGEKRDWVVEPWWNNLLGFLKEKKGVQFKMLDARSAFIQAAYWTLYVNAKKHGIEDQLPPLEQMVWTQFSEPKEAATGVSSADVPLSDHVQNSGSKAEHFKNHM